RPVGWPSLRLNSNKPTKHVELPAEGLRTGVQFPRLHQVSKKSQPLRVGFFLALPFQNGRYKRRPNHDRNSPACQPGEPTNAVIEGSIRRTTGGPAPELV